MAEQFPNARDCELLAYAPEAARFVELCPFIPDPIWYQPRWFEGRTDAAPTGVRRYWQRAQSLWRTAPQT